MSGLEGYAYSGKLQDLSDTTYDHLEKRYATVLPVGSNRAALDTIALGVYRVGAVNRVAEAGSSDTKIVLTGHGAKAGDFIQIKTSANGILENQVAVRKIVDANNIELEGVLSADVATGDTFDILRPIAQRLDSTGVSLASIDSSTRFVLDGVTVDVIEDTVTPANNQPLPVKLLDVTGDINITAGDLNVQLSHVGASSDSVRIGDGTDLLAVNADGSINVVTTSTDLDVRDLTHVSDSIKVGDGTDFLAVNGDGSINATVSATNLDIRDLVHTADSVKVGDGTDFLAISAAGAALVEATDLDIRDLTHASDSIKIGDGTDFLEVNGNGSINVVATATDLDIRDLTHASDSVKVGDGTDFLAISAGGAALVEAVNLDIRDLTHASDSVKVGDGTDFLAVNTDGSINVKTLDAGTVGARQFIRNAYASTNVTTGAFVELTASLTQAMTRAEIFDSGGETMELATGGSGSETVRFRIFPGGNGFVPLDAAIFAATTRVSIRAVSATANAGEININFYA